MFLWRSGTVLGHKCSPFMASAAWMSSVTAPATRFENTASCCFCSCVGFCRTWSRARKYTSIHAETQTNTDVHSQIRRTVLHTLLQKTDRLRHGQQNLLTQVQTHNAIQCTAKTHRRKRECLRSGRGLLSLTSSTCSRSWM